MTLKVCTDAYMLSTVDGLGLRRNWFPRVVAEAFLESTIDGKISRSPDPVAMIDGDLTWLNNTPDPQVLTMQILRAPRSIVAQSPGTVIIHDAWSWAVGESPTADFPSVMQDAVGGRMQIDRPATPSADLLYGRLFYDFDSCHVMVPIGEIAPMDVLHFRYLAACQTPGVWTSPSEFEPRWEAHARWARLLAFAVPAGSL